MILGLSFSHCSTACLVDEDCGRIVFCCSEERFTRKKNEWGIPYNTIQYIFSNICKSEKISKVTVGESCEANFGSPDFAKTVYLKGWLDKDNYIKNPFKLSISLMIELLGRVLSKKSHYRNIVTDELRNLGLNCEVSFIEHHKAHAATAYYCSPFDEALIVTLDGEGDSLCGSVWVGEEKKIESIHDLPDFASVGKYYRAITAATGFRVNRHEGKITGLAAFGDSTKYYDQFKELLHTKINEKGETIIVSKAAEYHLNKFDMHNINLKQLLSFFNEYLASKGWEDLLNKMFQQSFRQMFHDFFGWSFKDIDFNRMADLAAAAQYVMEETVVEYIKFYHQNYPRKNLALAGGLFANVKLNQRLWEHLGIEKIYIHPGMGDEGLAIGGAMVCYHEKRDIKCQSLNDVYLGPSFSTDHIERVLKLAGLSYEKLSEEEVSDYVSDALISEKIVGFYHGKMEYGPRALGHRTILVNPMDAEINNVVNKRLQRTEFMPFAPVVLDKCFSDIFSGENISGVEFTSKFMTITLDVKPEWRERIPGVVHIDGTARPQVITRTDDPYYYKIIERFHEKTGIGCMVNTSFNIHEEPIVNSPEDAIRAYQSNAVDILVLENFLVAFN